MTNEEILPIQEMWKGLNALYLECAAPVVDDVIKRVIAGLDAAREDEAVGFGKWLALKTGLYFDDSTMLWNLPDDPTDWNEQDWRKEYGQGFPEHQLRFTTTELYQLYKNEKQ